MPCSAKRSIRTASGRSLTLARTREAIHNGWDKNDPKDAQVILHMMRNGMSQRYYDPLAQGISDLQELSKTHEVTSKAKTEILHRIMTHYLPLYFPEIERFRNNSRSEWFFALLDAFPTPASITAYDKEGFVAAAWDVVGRKVSKARLIADIYETAQKSIALPVPLDSKAIAMFRMVIAEARSLIRQRDSIEAEAEALLKGHGDYELLKQIPGIGPINALTILAEAGDLRRFRHHRQFLKFCGLDLATHQSGAFRGQTKLSKFGNARLRRTLWMAAQVAIRQRENSFRQKYEHYIAKPTRPLRVWIGVSDRNVRLDGLCAGCDYARDVGLPNVLVAMVVAAMGRHRPWRRCDRPTRPILPQAVGMPGGAPSRLLPFALPV